jgi:hypothetical protein
MAARELNDASLLALINKERAEITKEREWRGESSLPAFTSQSMIELLYDGSSVPDAAKIDAAHLAGLINAVMKDTAIRHVLAGVINANRNETMVSLINSHNPYTSHNLRDMTIFAGNPDLENDQQNDISQIDLEVDGPYSMPMEWNFKGSPQKINKTIRLKYKYRARDLNKPDRPLLQPPHWVTAYMLIGYEDGGE